jgi:hypothetical protein
LFPGAFLFAAGTPADTVSLEVVPASIELRSCADPAKLLVIVRNLGSHALSGFELASFSDVPVDLAPKPPVLLDALAPRDQKSWLFGVTCSSGFSAGSLHFVASGNITEGGAAVSWIATQSVAVKLRIADTLDSVVAIDVKSTLESLTQAVNGSLIFAATNKTPQPLFIKVAARPSASVLLDSPSPPAEGIEIPGGQTGTIPFTATARKRVSPGKQLLVFDVQINTGGGWRKYLITREVSVGVLGESEMLKLLGVPSLLFLPGVLVLTSFSLLWRCRVWRPAASETKLPIDEKDPGFWVISIILSAAIFAGFMARRPDFLSLYGLEDIADVWLVSIGIGMGAYLLYQSGVHGWALYRIPQPGDPPLRTLRKLERRHLSMAVRRVKLKDIEKAAFVLESYPDGSACVCPQMVLTWKRGAGGDVRNTVELQLTRDGKPGTVADMVDRDRNGRGGTPQIGDLAWDRSDMRNSSPHVVSKEAIERALEEPEIILREEEV